MGMKFGGTFILIPYRLAVYWAWEFTIGKIERLKIININSFFIIVL
tara:strand:- start:876 stop:1013 length:138 start_codon:yes stop_codon:yes gene_type:complete